MNALKNVMLNEEVATKKCSKCGGNKPLNSDFFHKNSHSKTGFRSDCKDCSNNIARKWRENNRHKALESTKKWREKNRDFWKNNYQKNKNMIDKQHKEYYDKKKVDVPLYNRKRHLKLKFNITIKEYNKLLLKQNGRCLICGKKELEDSSIKYFIIDHNHKTGDIRGLLCRKCNSFLGFVNDNPLILARAIKYLRGEL